MNEFRMNRIFGPPDYDATGTACNLLIDLIYKRLTRDLMIIVWLCGCSLPVKNDNSNIHCGVFHRFDLRTLRVINYYLFLVRKEIFYPFFFVILSLAWGEQAAFVKNFPRIFHLASRQMLTKVKVHGTEMAKVQVFWIHSRMIIPKKSQTGQMPTPVPIHMIYIR